MIDDPNSIRHRTAGGHFKTPMRPSAVPASQITTQDLAAIRLDVPDGALDLELAKVGEQMLAMEPQSAGPHDRVGYVIPGRNALAVKFACWDARRRWPGVSEWRLVIVPDTVKDPVLQPEFVRMIDPRVIYEFRVEAGLGG